MITSLKHLHRQSRKRRIRAKVRGTRERPRLSVYRSLTAISVQLVDDQEGKTIVSVQTKEVHGKPTVEGAKTLGKFLAKKALAANINTIVFDRNAYKYHGRIKALADAAREGGLVF